MYRQQKKEIVVPVQNRFAAFDTDSDTEEEADVIVEKEEEEIVKEEPQQEQRVWPSVKEEVDPVSLFTSQRKTRRSGVQMQEDSEGWVSITRSSRPVKEEDEEKEIQKEVLEEIQAVEVKPVEPVEVEKANFVPLLARGGGASVWATRIRESLEKAEKATPPNPNVATEQFISGLGGVSFFK